MRTGLMLITVAASVLLTARPAAAVAGFDSAYVGESDFLSLAPGQSGTFQAFFLNTGTVAWVKGTDSQVDLAACLEDKATCDRQDASEVPFDAGTWRSATRYAAQSQAVVAPRQGATFTYRVTARSDQAPGTYRFNGELVVSATGATIHPEGYFHELTVLGPACTPASIAASPSFTQRQVGIPYTQFATVLCADGRAAADVSVTFVVDAPIDSPNPDLSFTATTGRDGLAQILWTRTNPGIDAVDAYPTRMPALRSSAIARWTVASRVLDCQPTDAVTRGNGEARTFTITAKDPVSGGPLAGAGIDVSVTAIIGTGTATINGANAVLVESGATVVTATTGADGTATLNVSGTSATIRPRAFLDDDNSNTLGRTEFRTDCGSTKFVS